MFNKRDSSHAKYEMGCSKDTKHPKHGCCALTTLSSGVVSCAKMPVMASKRRSRATK